MSPAARAGAPKVYAFETWPAERPDWKRVSNHLTVGKAKYDHWRDINEVWRDVPITQMRGRKVGAPVTSEAFRHNARYRGIPEVECGDRVRLSGVGCGTIVGHNSSANLNVLFDPDSKYPGQTLNVHPLGDAVEFLPIATGIEGVLRAARDEVPRG